MQFFNVTMPWDVNGDPDSEGTYTTTVRAADQDQAKRLCAEEMGASGQREFDSDSDREDYIDAIAENWADVYPTAEQLQQDMATIYGEQLFPDGVKREINLEALGQVLAQNRELVIGAGVPDLNAERRDVTRYALESLVELLSSPESADRAADAAQADRHIEVAKELLKLIPQIDDTVIRKARALDRLMGELVEMGFATDDPINGGDCVDSIAQIYERLSKQFPR